MVQMESDDEPARGDVAPGFELPGVDGETHALSEFDEPAVLVVFTCNHCPYAKAKFDALNAIADDYDDCLVVGINPNDDGEYPEDSFEKMEEYVADGRVDYDYYLRDESQDVARAYAATCTPDPYLLRREGDDYVLAYHGRLDDAMNPDDEPSGEPGFEMRGYVDAVLAGEEITDDSKPSRGCSIKWKDE